jgi:putative SOS response-associated peptidase YedK
VCANYGLDKSDDEVGEYLGVAGVELPAARNFFPKSPIPVVRVEPGIATRGLVVARWGLVPSYYSDPTQQPQPFNARSESIDRLDVFRESFRQRRCLIPADQFYEWTATTPKTRYRLALAGGALFTIACVWDVCGDKLVSATMATTAANELLKSLPHHRMPVILRADQFAEWLDPAAPLKAVKAMLKPYPADEMVKELAPRAAGKK